MEFPVAEGGIVRISRTFAAPAEQLFQAWTDPELLRLWFRPTGGTSPSATLDLRVGGGFRVEMRHPPGQAPCAVGTFLEVQPPLRLAFTLAWEGYRLDPGESRVTVGFNERDAETEVVLVQELIRNRASKAFFRWGWSGAFGRLARLLGTTVPAPADAPGAAR